MKNMEYVTFNIGNNELRSHVDAVHAQSPKADKYTGEIVSGLIQKINSSGIIAKVSRTQMDINRPRSNRNAPAIDEYREAIREIVQSKNILSRNNELDYAYLHLSIHGMANAIGTDFEIGTSNGNSCSGDVKDWFVANLSLLSKRVGINRKLPVNVTVLK
jgi:hypothetical protein